MERSEEERPPDFNEFNTLLDGAINVANLVDKESERPLDEDQKFWIVVHCMCFKAWTSETPDKPNEVARTGAYLSLTEAKTFQELKDYLSDGYDIPRCADGETPIQVLIDKLKKKAQEY